MPELNAWWIVGAMVAVAIGLWWCLDAVKEVPLPRRDESHDADIDPMSGIEQRRNPRFGAIVDGVFVPLGPEDEAHP